MRRTINTKEAAILFNRSQRTMQRWASEDSIPAKKRKGRWVIDAGRLGATWSAVMSGRKPSARPAEDFQRFRRLITDLERGDVDIYEDAQRDALELALSLLATGDGFREPVWRIIQRVKEGPAFAFFSVLPDFAG